MNSATLLNPTMAVAARLPLHAVQRPAVLFAMLDDERPTQSLLRARALARVLDAELHVLQVLTPLHTSANMLFPQRHASQALDALHAFALSEDTLREWLRHCVVESAVADVQVAEGDFLTEVRRHVAALNPALVVMPPRSGRFGTLVTTMANVTHVPVLVARDAMTDDAIVAATDLESPDYPVLRRAAQLAQQLEAPVIAVHNVNPVTPVSAGDMTWPAMAMTNEPLRKAREEQLTTAARALGVFSEPVLREDLSSVEAILGEARKRQADLVIVGSRQRSWLERLVAGNVAAQVVDRSRRSVLVLPLETEGLNGE